MFAAQLYGKLTRREEDLEDLLTSNVFGTFKYISPENGLIPLLNNSQRLDGSYPFRELSQISNVEYKFWYGLNEENCKSCEPDVLIYITNSNGNQIIVLVEAKYKSGKSSMADDTDKPNDQLAREWDNLIVLAKELKANPYLLYVTADILFPTKDLEDAQFEFKKKRKDNMDIVWISWRKLPLIYYTGADIIVKDLIKILQRQWLIYFEGVESPEYLPKIDWKFQENSNQFDWTILNIRIRWDFRNE